MRHFILLLLILTACSSPVEPLPLPSGAEPTSPPVHLDRLELELEYCSGLDADFSGIDWYVIPGDSFIDSEGRLVWGSYRSSGAILLTEASYALDGRIKHEMLHHLLYTLGGETGHPVPPYVRCAPL